MIESTPRVSLGDEEVRRFSEEGYLSIARPLVGPDGLAEVRRLLDGLFDRADRLPQETYRNLGAGVGTIPQIDNPRLLTPALTSTAAFSAVRDVATQLLGTAVRCTYDHVIYKPPHNQAATDWHQDLAYEGVPKHGTVHLWMPLQDVAVANGCMQFIPYSHRGGLARHEHRASDPTAHALHVDVDQANAVACPLPAGGVTVHTPTTLHYTGPNDTDEVRRAWVLHFGAEDRAAWQLTLSRSRLGDLRRWARARAGW